MNPVVLLFGLGVMEIILILAVVLLLFGGRKIPELFKGIGQGMKEFKKNFPDNDGEDQPAEKQK